ncbi:MAG: EpsI family protein [Armatimonadota bacterium]|nr:EpsI family protein [Armatimonadota bacterium]
MCVVWFVLIQRIPPYGADVKLIEKFEQIPFSVGDWYSDKERSSIRTSVKGLPTSSVLNRLYTNSNGDKVILTIVYASSLGDMHQPEICLMGQGWAISEPRKISLHPKQKLSFKAMKAMLSNEVEGRDELAVYWFDSPVGKSTLLPKHKIKIYLSRLTKHGTVGTALVRIMTPVSGFDDEERGLKAAVDLANEISPHIDILLAKPPVIKKQ